MGFPCGRTLSESARNPIGDEIEQEIHRKSRTTGSLPGSQELGEVSHQTLKGKEKKKGRKKPPRPAKKKGLHVQWNGWRKRWPQIGKKGSLPSIVSEGKFCPAPEAA